MYICLCTEFVECLNILSVNSVLSRCDVCKLDVTSLNGHGVELGNWVQALAVKPPLVPETCNPELD